VTPLLPSLGSTAENVLAHLRQWHDTALIAAPGSGATTLTRHIAAELRREAVDVISLDLRTPILAERAFAALQAMASAASADRPCAALIDHAASLPAGQLPVLLERVSAAAADGRSAVRHLADRRCRPLWQLLLQRDRHRRRPATGASSSSTTTRRSRPSFWRPCAGPGDAAGTCKPVAGDSACL